MVKTYLVQGGAKSDFVMIINAESLPACFAAMESELIEQGRDDMLDCDTRIYEFKSHTGVVWSTYWDDKGKALSTRLRAPSLTEPTPGFAPFSKCSRFQMPDEGWN